MNRRNFLKSIFGFGAVAALAKVMPPREGSVISKALPDPRYNQPLASYHISFIAREYIPVGSLVAWTKDGNTIVNCSSSDVDRIVGFATHDFNDGDIVEYSPGRNTKDIAQTGKAYTA